MKSLLVSLLMIALALTGCGSYNPVNPPAVKAAAPPPANCDVNGSCFIHEDHEWGYCHISSQQSANTFSIDIEIGINKNVSDPNDSICNVPFAFGGNVTAIQGNIDYVGWSKSEASMLAMLRACSQDACSYPDQQEQLYSVKTIALPGQHTAYPFYMAFAKPVKTRRFMLVFNDDLAEAKPTTMSFSFSGTLQ